ncbi:iron-siderophore ABC transporter substrate-binding protein [Brevibacillus nitrificans]|uniref:Iron-siderophore ABC transporter substrate-binding protein n=1 Tax=Brevibacillus nitrificans TaxID=651560 RepID=A0A3M8CRQ0_9BACL|nr:iron-siderophore ABC transporter substrate-binding protein [Brevibacillus nitrificans]RNB78091.1 iron-siderophore ABC transporter substrate-binding protein [Brevibacillus nitrificans]
MNKKRNLFVLFMAIMLMAVGCSSGVSESAPGNSTTVSDNGSSQPITIKHLRGETTLDKPAERVVVLEWAFAENLIALGIQPIGNADNQQYKIWEPAEAALDDNVTDIGLRNEPNLETIASLKPDLIISNADNNAAIYDQLNAIAPTIEFNQFPDQGDQYTEMVHIFESTAAAVGKTDKAKQVLSELEQHYVDAKEKLSKAGKEGSNYVLTQAFTVQNAAALRLFTDNSIVVQTLDRIGLKSDWKSSKFEKYGFTDATVEALPAVTNTNFIYIVENTDNVFENQLKDNTVWNGLNFVKEKRAHMLDASTWTFGGPISSKVLVDRVVQVFTQ